MATIVATTASALAKESQTEWLEAKAEAAKAVIDADLATLAGSWTQQDIIDILTRALNREKKIINFLVRVVDGNPTA